MILPLLVSRTQVGSELSWDADWFIDCKEVPAGGGAPLNAEDPGGGPPKIFPFASPFGAKVVPGCFLSKSTGLRVKGFGCPG